MSRIALHIASLVLASACAASAHAQSAAPAIALTVNNGNVLVSTGGEFTQATSGQAIAPGHRVLVPEGGGASLAYGNGCGKSLTTAGVYTVTADCDLASTSRSVSTGTVLGIVGGVAVIAAVAGGGGSDDDDNNNAPISR